MQLVAVGVDHRTAPLALRERLVVHGDRLDEALQRLRTVVPEGFLLSTCNRVEIYGLAGHAESGGRLFAALLAELGGVSPDTLGPSLVVHSSGAAVEHLFRVASGIESMVTGESEILAQLKTALARADARDCLGPVTHRLGAAALGVGKRVRSTTGIARRALSVVSVALDEADARIGTLAGRSVLVVGAGNTAELALKHLAGYPGGVARRLVVARDEAQSKALAERLGATALPWASLEEALGQIDVVVSCTRAPGYVIDREMVERAQARRGKTRLVIADLATPRDVDPAAAEIAGVSLFDIDRVEAVARENRSHRTGEVRAAETIIAEHVTRYLSWFTARQVAPTTTALVAHATAIRDAELARALAQMSALVPSDERAVRALAARLVNKLIHAPLVSLGEHPEAGNMAVVLRELFRLTPTPRRATPVVGQPAYRADADELSAEIGESSIATAAESL